MNQFPRCISFLGTTTKQKEKETKDLNEARIYVGTYSKYNNGSLQGELVVLSDFYDLDGVMERCA
ncbi:MAG: antirestriction protein ArdA, partial [Prevotella sp.]|nr:antirestriction protein ArdA [Prevotella sp.]